MGLGYDIYVIKTEGASFKNVATFLVDVVLAVAPFIPSIGGLKALGKAASHGDEVVKLGKAASHGDEIVKGAEAIASREGAKLLSGTVDTIADHHLLPRQFKGFFKQRGIDIDQFTITIGHKTIHLKGIHGKGLGDMPGRWNQRWADFIETNPNATAKEVYQYLGRMMDDFGLSGYRIHPYKK